MNQDVKSPQSVKPTRKHCFDPNSTDRTLTTASTKRCLQSNPKPTSLPLPTPTISHYDSSSQRLNQTAVQLQPTATLKRSFEDESPNLGDSLDYNDDPDCIPSKRRCLEPSPLWTSTVSRWLSSLPLPNTASPLLPSTTPPDISRSWSAPPFDTKTSAPSFNFPDFPISQFMPPPPSVASTTNTRLSTSDPSYRELIYRNGIILDPTGLEVEENEDIKELLEKHILKGGDSPLPDDQVKKVIKKAADLLDNAEGKAGDLIKTDAFPLERPGSIAEGRSVQWSTDALPTNPRYRRQLSAPKPDHHYGYSVGRKFEEGWADKEMAVIDHRAAQPYTQPTRDNYFPFLSLEFKSEATGGSLYIEENQGVGSRLHIVASRRWLFQQAFPSKAIAATDAIAFVGAVSPRTGIFYAVWYSDTKNRYVMSKIRVVSFMDASDIQRCREIIKNILDYELGIPLLAIREALAALESPPPHWKKSRSADSLI